MSFAYLNHVSNRMPKRRGLLDSFLGEQQRRFCELGVIVVVVMRIELVWLNGIVVVRIEIVVDLCGIQLLMSATLLEL